MNASCANDAAPESVQVRNQAFAFIKPHAVRSQAVAMYIADVFEDEGIKVSFQVRKTASEIASEKLLDLHYGRLAEIAFEADPSRIAASEAGRGEFEGEFGETWEKAVAAGEVLGCDAARERMGGISAKELCTEWAANGAIEMDPDMFVSRFSEQGFYVLNGFYPALREAYVAEDASVHAMLLDFQADWREFREKSIGSENPAAALEESIRGYLYDRAGVLEMVIDPIDNIMHVSDSPFSALCDKMVWLDRPQWISDPLLVSVASATGMNAAEVAKWVAARAGDHALRKSFEDMDTEHVAVQIAAMLSTPPPRKGRRASGK